MNRPGRFEGVGYILTALVEGLKWSRIIKGKGV